MDHAVLALPVERVFSGLLAAVVVVGLIWITGLVVALRGAPPAERADIITAYGKAFPWRRSLSRKGRGRRLR